MHSESTSVELARSSAPGALAGTRRAGRRDRHRGDRTSLLTIAYDRLDSASTAETRMTFGRNDGLHRRSGSVESDGRCASGAPAEDRRRGTSSVRQAFIVRHPTRDRACSALLRPHSVCDAVRHRRSQRECVQKIEARHRRIHTAGPRPEYWALHSMPVILTAASSCERLRFALPP